MTRWALLLEYDGAGFVGWQRQAVGVSIQAVLEDAAAHLAGEPVSSITAGRTDAGVHALGQVAHIYLARDITGDKLASALNFHMKPHRVTVLKAARVPPEWNARFSATGRAYRYVILNRRARPALAEGRVWHVPQPLNAALMAEAARHLLGKHDFSSFRAASCQAASPIRTLDRLDVVHGAETIDIIAEARSFLHHQVRNMAGTLKLIGEGRWPPDAMAGILAAADRSAAGPTAPPEGLFLTGVRYPEDVFGQEDLGETKPSPPDPPSSN
jgi:tRNA pseudouridine38-40 synthase